MRIGFIGAGKMAASIIRGLIDAGTCRPEEIVATDIDDAVLNLLNNTTGVQTTSNLERVAGDCDVLMLCTKPADIGSALRDICRHASGKLVVSIAAGVDLTQLEALAPGCRIVRVMPNTPALVHKGAAVFALGHLATEADADLVQSIFNSVGVSFRAEEKYLDAVTGLSGSGPAYVFMVIDAMADGGVLNGLPRSMALQLAAQTVAGAAQMILQTGDHPGELKDNVASPGGTTMAGIAVMEEAGVRSAMIRAVTAATRRAVELRTELAANAVESR